MKRHILLFFIVFLFLTPLAAEAQREGRHSLLVTVLQDPPVLSSRREIEKLIAFAKRTDIDILFVQIYRSNQAWFASAIADSSPYRIDRENLGEDPLGLLIKQAHAAGIRVYAWLNCLSLGNNKDARLLKKYGTEILTRNLNNKAKIEDYKIDSQYFLEPGDLRVRRELSGIVGEILRAYPELDGLLFDYVRYPDTEPDYGHTRMNMDRFQKATGRPAAGKNDPAWQEWKRAQVTELLEGLAATARALRPGIGVAATGCAPLVRALEEAFQDWPSWIRQDTVDFIVFMNYSPDPEEFKSFIDGARKETPDFGRVMAAIPAYKLTKSPWLFARQLRICEESGSGGCAIFHYGSLLENPALGRLLKKRAVDENFSS
jgi:uncharacterized lipoprotein YddW (UPF0748 family)